VSVFWGRRGDSWEPTGGQCKEWRHLQPGDLIVVDRKVWSVIEVRTDPVVDWHEQDHRYWEWHCGPSEVVPGQIRRRKPHEGLSREEWPLRPLGVVSEPPGGGRREHFEVRPYLRSRAYVLHPHYPVCASCGEPYPCSELDIKDAEEKASAELTRLEGIMPGCCWACAEVVTSRQKSAVFTGENLLLPGGPPVVFHLREKSKGGVSCLHAAMDYEERWVPAGPARRWRLSCPGNAIWHVDGRECAELDDCPGQDVRHRGNVMQHRFTGTREGEVVPVPGSGAEHCRRCQDAVDAGFYADQVTEYLARKAAEGTR
jgi:hypothetical protein